MAQRQRKNPPAGMPADRRPKVLEVGGLRIRELDGWCTHQQVAALIGVTRMAIHLAEFERHEFDPDDLAFVDLGHQPLYLIRAEAVDRWLMGRRSAELSRTVEARQRDAGRAAEQKQRADRETMRQQFVAMGLMRRRQRISYVNEVLGRDVDDWFYLESQELAKVIAAQRAGLRQRGAP